MSGKNPIPSPRPQPDRGDRGQVKGTHILRPTLPHDAANRPVVPNTATPHPIAPRPPGRIGGGR